MNSPEVCGPVVGTGLFHYNALREIARLIDIDALGNAVQ